MWPFGKNKKDARNAEGVVDSPGVETPNVDRSNSDSESSSTEQLPAAPGTHEGMYAVSRTDEGDDSDLPRLTASGGGPFDVDDTKPEHFDFSDFAKANLNLGSVLLPIPHIGDVQVEMGPQGPTMLHVVTPHGRLTPVAFAAPTDGGQWESSAAEIHKGLADDGLSVHDERGPWGTEVVGRSGDMEMRIIGTDGHRWMLRVTATGPAEAAEQLAQVARGVMARSFVSRGNNPIPAGQPLPVTLPAQMAEEIRNAYQAQLQQQSQDAEEQQL